MRLHPRVKDLVIGAKRRWRPRWGPALMRAIVHRVILGMEPPSFATETNGAAQATQAPSWAASIDRMAQAVLKMSEKQIKLAEQPDARADKADKKVFTTYSLHALMGWSGVRQENKIAPIWAKLLTTKNYDDHRLNIHSAMKIMARNKEMKKNC